MKATPLYDYDENIYLMTRPYMDKVGPFQVPAANSQTVKGFYTLWIRNNPGDQKVGDPMQAGQPMVDVDAKIMLIVEAWVKKYDEQLDFDPTDDAAREAASQGTTQNPIVARTVIAELITPKQEPLLAYAGRNIDLHNTNTIYGG
jgi:hypothetical protein